MEVGAAFSAGKAKRDCVGVRIGRERSREACAIVRSARDRREVERLIKGTPERKDLKTIPSTI
jgi:hypothetical protein